VQQQDREDYIARYRRRLEEHGYSPQTLGWGVHGRQEVRFAVLAQEALRRPLSSVLDVGCGFADLHGFLRARGWRGKYTGIDIVPELLAVARERHPELDLREVDGAEDATDLPRHDFVIASGVFNARLKVGDNRRHIVEALQTMHGRADVAVCVDFLSLFVDFEKPEAWHTDPSWVMAEARRLTRRILLRADYMPFEFALFLFRDDSVSSRNVFEAVEATLEREQA
jgi:SAM-dependent methyltransferase